MSNTINVLIVLDTDRVKTISNPSQDSAVPTPIDHTFGYMVASGTSIVSGQGTGDLNFNAHVGDTVRAFAVSGSDNFEDAVLLYGMPRFQGPQVMSPFNYLCFQNKSTIEPQGTANPLPDVITNDTFWLFQGTVVNAGTGTGTVTEGYQVQFGLYARDANEQPALFGYYQWDPFITVGN